MKKMTILVAALIISATMFGIRTIAANAGNDANSVVQEERYLSGVNYCTSDVFVSKNATEMLENIQSVDRFIADNRSMGYVYAIKTMNMLVVDDVIADSDGYTVEIGNGAKVGFLPGHIRAGGLKIEPSMVWFETGDRVHMSIADGGISFVDSEGTKAFAKVDYGSAVIENAFFSTENDEFVTAADIALLNLAIQYSSGDIGMAQPPATTFEDPGMARPPATTFEDPGMARPPATAPLSCTEVVTEEENDEETSFFAKLRKEFGENYAKNAEAINEAYMALSNDKNEVNSDDILKALGYDYEGYKTGRPVSDAQYNVNNWTVLVNSEQIYDDDGRFNAGITISIYDDTGVEMTIVYGSRGVEIYTDGTASIFDNVMLGEVSDCHVIRSAISQKIGYEESYYDTNTLATLLCILNTCAAF